MELITNLTKVEDSIVDTIKSVQEPVVGYVRQAVEFVDSRLPELPELPFADQLPQPGALVDNGYRLRQGTAGDELPVRQGARHRRLPAAPHRAGAGPQAQRQAHRQGRRDAVTPSRNH